METRKLGVGREMDMAVHTAVFGGDWRQECSYFRQDRCVDGRITYCGACGGQGHGNCYGNGTGAVQIECDARCSAPRYSEYIEAAWLIVEHFSPDRTAMKCHLHQIDDGRWRCWFSVTFDDDTDAWGETAPLAICRAALRTVENWARLKREAEERARREC